MSRLERIEKRVYSNDYIIADDDLEWLLTEAKHAQMMRVALEKIATGRFEEKHYDCDCIEKGMRATAQAALTSTTLSSSQEAP